MNIHEPVLQPIAAFVYCNRQAAAGRRRKFPRACATELRPCRSVHDWVERKII